MKSINENLDNSLRVEIKEKDMRDDVKALVSLLSMQASLNNDIFIGIEYSIALFSKGLRRAASEDWSVK